MGLVEAKQSGQELRSHVGDGGTQRMALFAIHVEEASRAAMEVRVLDAKLRAAFFNEAAHLSRLADARQVAFHVGHETRYASLAEAFGNDLQGDGLTRTRGTGNQAVAVGHFAHHIERAVVAMRNVKLVVVSEHISRISRFQNSKI